ncbi:hypothetical protein [Arenimonas sp.]|uniref:hypothetical protein n=1 Tax=Arenimonas sp. TaxID=1872635 RepID=UPI0039E50979
MSLGYCPRNGKAIHATQHDAAKAVRKHGAGSAYHCEYCHGWHHSSGTKKGMRNRKRRKLADNAWRWED